MYQKHLHTSTEKDGNKPHDLEPRIKVSARCWTKNAPRCPPESFLEKTWKKVLTNGNWCGSISKHSREWQTNSDRNWWSLDRNAEKIEEFGLKAKRENSLKNLEKSSWQRSVNVLRWMSQRASDWRRAVPCKLNNAKMTFITVGQIRF